MNKTILSFVLIIGVVFGVVYVSFNKSISSETTTTTTLLDKSALMSKYLSDRKFCVDDFDCNFRCGISAPVACENRYWTANQTDLLCTGASPFARYKIPACLCNTTKQCYINDTEIMEYDNSSSIKKPIKQIVFGVQSSYYDNPNLSFINENIHFIVHFESNEKASKFEKEYAQYLIANYGSYIKIKGKAFDFLLNKSSLLYLRRLAYSDGVTYIEPVIIPIDIYSSNSTEVITSEILFTYYNESNIQIIRSLSAGMNSYDGGGINNLYTTDNNLKKIADLDFIYRIESPRGVILD